MIPIKTMGLENIIQRWAELQPSKLAASFIGSKSAYTYSALEKTTSKIRRSLDTIGVREGEVIAISFKDAERTVLYLISLLKIGASPLCIDSSLAGENFAELVRFAGPEGILLSCDDRRMEGMLEKDPDFCRTAIEGTRTEAALLKKGPKKSPGHATSILLPTSGTTGKPRIVQISQKAFITNAKDICGYLDITKDDTFLSMTPVSYCHGFYNGVLMPLVNGAGTVVMDKFDAFRAGKFWAIIEENSVSVVNIVPTMIEMIMRMNYPDFAKPASLRFFICGTAKIQENQRKAFEERFKVRVFTQYGMTESLINTVNRADGKPSSPGLPVGCSISIMDAEDRPLPAGKVGEITISGDSVTCGYFKDPGLTSAVIKGKSLKSGDLGYLDDDGYLYIIGRAKEMVNKGGVKIYPEEVSDVFKKHPSVFDACTVGINDDIYGEDIFTFLVLNRGEKVTAEEILFFARGHLPNTKIPRKIFFVDSIPRGATGKPKLEELKQKARRNIDVKGY